MSETQRIAIIEMLKTVGRGLWFGFLGLVVTALTTIASSGAISNITLSIGGLEINLAILLIAIIGFIAKAIDRYIHKNENIRSNGIAPKFLQN